MSKTKITNPRNNRLIILGAGASCEAGISPTSSQLIQIMRRTYEILPEYFKQIDSTAMLKDCGTEFTENDFIGIIKNLIDANPTSIDAYISSISIVRDQRLLKSFIISIITIATAFSEAYQDKYQENWYFKIWNLIQSEVFEYCSNDKKLEKLKNVKQNQLLITTFNYDISLELYLKKMLRESLHNEHKDYSSYQEAISEFCNNNIKHVYGKINIENYPQLKSTIEDYKEKFSKIKFSEYNLKKILEHKNIKYIKDPFKRSSDFISIGKENPGSTLISLTINNALTYFKDRNKDKLFLDQIKTINEERDDKKDLGEKEWSTIHILGYGFDEDNNKRIKLNELKWKNALFFTNYGGNNMIYRKTFSENLFFKKPEIVKENMNISIPLCSELSVGKALNNDFSLQENPKNKTIVVPDIYRFDPYQELKKHSIIT